MADDDPLPILWVTASIPNPTHPIPVPVIGVDTTERPDVRDLSRALRSEGPPTSAAGWFAIVERPKATVLLVVRVTGSQ
jgi:hypothetical protein